MQNNHILYTSGIQFFTVKYCDECIDKKFKKILLMSYEYKKITRDNDMVKFHFFALKNISKIFLPF